MKIEKIQYQTSIDKLYTIDGREVTPKKSVWVISKRLGLFKKTYIRFHDNMEELVVKLGSAWKQFEFNFTNKLGATEFKSKDIAEKVVALMRKHPSYFITKSPRK